MRRMERPNEIPEHVNAWQVHDRIWCTETQSGHYYFDTKVQDWYKGFTTITGNLPMEEPLKRWLTSRASYEDAMRELEDAANRGTAIHSAIPELLEGTTLKRNEFTEEVWQHLLTFRNFYQDYKPETLAIEQPIWDTRRKIASCIDWRGILDDKHTALDWKSSKGVYLSHELQVNEYGFVFNHLGDQEEWWDEEEGVEQVGVLRTNSRHKRGYELKLMDIDEYKHKIFNCLLWVEHSRHPDWEPKFPKEVPSEISLD